MIVQRQLAGQPWKSQYQFTLKPYRLEDFEARCQFQQTSPESHFTRQRVCTLRTPDGRITLSDLHADPHCQKSSRRADAATVKSEWQGALVEYFGVRL